MFFSLSTELVEEGSVFADLGIVAIYACLASPKHFHMLLEFLILSRDLLVVSSSN